MFIDSDHSKNFAKSYLRAGVFNKCSHEAYIHIHDFYFWLKKGCPLKYQEPEVIGRYMRDNPARFEHYCMGQLFTLLGGYATRESLYHARSAQKGFEYFSDANYFIRSGLRDEYWLGGSIAGINKEGVHHNRTWLSGLALWMLPR